jgi:hypothetical protein
VGDPVGEAEVCERHARIRSSCMGVRKKLFGVVSEGRPGMLLACFGEPRRTDWLWGGNVWGILQLVALALLIEFRAERASRWRLLCSEESSAEGDPLQVGCGSYLPTGSPVVLATADGLRGTIVLGKKAGVDTGHAMRARDLLITSFAVLESGVGPGWR